MRTDAGSGSGAGVGVRNFFLNKLSLSLHNFRNFPGHSTGKQRTDDTRHARSARTRKDALTSAVSKAPPFSKKSGEIWRKCPIYKTEFRINVPSEYFFLGSANAPRRAQWSHQAIFSCEKGRAYSRGTQKNERKPHDG